MTSPFFTGKKDEKVDAAEKCILLMDTDEELDADDELSLLGEDSEDENSKDVKESPESPESPPPQSNNSGKGSYVSRFFFCPSTFKS